MGVKHLLSIADLETQDLQGLVEDAVAIAGGAWSASLPLAGKTVGIYFRRSSTRTRTSFAVGAMKLGAQTITYGAGDLQLVTGETLEDTARVLANYLDLLVVRSNGPLAEMQAMATQGRLAIVNALSDCEHPTQALADLAAIREAMGRLRGLHLLYLGEGNCTAASLAQAVARLPEMALTLVTPPGYGLPEQLLTDARRSAAMVGSTVEQRHDPTDLPRGVDVVYTSRWLEMGKAKADPDWLASFRPYAVTEEFMARVSRPGTIFLHDLPAMRGYEVADAVLDGAQSIALRQSFHKMTSAMAALAWCVGAGPNGSGRPDGSGESADGDG